MNHAALPERPGAAKTAQNAKRIKGVVAAITTPITARMEPDHGRLVALARKLLDGGCDGLNVLGTTGEATSFTVQQRMDVMSALAKAGLPLHRLMVGTGAAAVGDAVQLARHAAEVGYTGVLVLPPFYYKNVPDAGVIAYIGAIAEATPLPIYLYNFPALSAVPYTPALVKALVAEFGTRIAGLKDSSGDVPYAREIAAISPNLDVFPSSEANLLDARDGGPFAGCISATANVNAVYCGKAYHDGDKDALAKAVAIRKLFDGLPLIPGIKVLVGHMMGDPAYASVMPPMVGFSDADAAKLRERFQAIA